MKKLNKKGAFETINAGMLTFISFVLVSILVIVLLSTVENTSLICDGTYFEGQCLRCNGTKHTVVNTSDYLCYNSTTDTKSATVLLDGTDAYNGTQDLQLAAELPPQFAQIIVITLVIVGILGMLAVLGFGAYQRMRR